MIALQRVQAIEFRYWVLAAYGWGGLAVTLLPAGTRFGSPLCSVRVDRTWFRALRADR